ncbi:MAG: nucleotidyltransferase domain-containing protein [Anaerolineae bacterium]|jgi:predicted nucleotidyltransferase|nr:nucleotidyltransferase domain-containing protein [Anaerolineae bacterium]
MDTHPIIAVIQAYYPEVQAIYLFGSYGTGDEWPTSDVDIALLLPHIRAKSAGSLAMSELRFALESLLHRDVDLINLRLVSTVFQKEAITADRRLFCADAHAVDEFEMMTLSFYAKLGDERRSILEQFRETGRAYEV